MATVTNLALSTTSIRSTISELSYAVNWYDSFRFDVYISTDNFVNNQSWYTYYTASYPEYPYNSSYSYSHDFNGLPEGYYYAVNVTAYKSPSSWLIYGSNKVYLPYPPSIPTINSVYATGKDITINFTKGSNSNYTWVDTSWVGGTDNNLTSGTSITITAPNYDTTYIVALSAEGAYVNGSYLRSAWSSVQYITTGSPPALAQPSFSSTSATSTSISYTLASVTNSTWYNVDLYKNGVLQTNNASSYANSGSFTGLIASTEYYLVITVTASGYTSNSRGYYITTNAPPTLSQPTFTSLTQTSKSISFTTSNVSNATSYDVTLKLNGNYVDSRSGTSGLSGTFANLTYNTGYTVTVTVSASGYTGNNNTSSITTSNLTVGIPTNINGQQPASSLSVDLYYSWGASATAMDFRWGTDGTTWNTYSSQANNLYPSPNYNIGVSTIGNKYFQVRSVNYDGYNTIYSAWVSTTPYPINVIAINLRPSNFAWTTTISQGGNIYLTDLPNKILYIITAAEWNALTTKINLFRVYKGLGNYSFTAVSSGTIITKAIINEAITAITAITGRSINPPATLVTGDIVNKASLYTGLRDSLNSTT